ncbi:MAG: TetR/AcrR family transcriptional regulator [Bacillota bacterium]
MLQTKEKILKAAKYLFSEKGYNETSTKKIAREAGVNEVTIFRLFETKSKLLQEIVTNFAYEGNIIDKLQEEITGDLIKDLYVFARVYYKFLENNIDLYKIQIKEIAEEGETFTNSINYVAFMKAYLQTKKNEGEFKGDPQMVASSMVTLIFGLFSFDVYNPDIYNEEVNHQTIMETFVEHIIKLYCQ